MHEQPELEPLEPLDLDKCDNIAEVLDSMDNISFGGRDVSKAWTVLKKVADDPDCGLILTMSGAMTVAKLGCVIGALISRGLVKTVVATGAIVTHSMVEELGMNHYKRPEGISDEQLLETSLNRVYDTIEPEANLEELEDFAKRQLADLDTSRTYGSYELIRYLVGRIDGIEESDNFLAAAYANNVNVYVPALTDSELGLYLFRYNQFSSTPDVQAVIHDPVRDLAAYAEWVAAQKRIAFLTLGGGAPRNWGQQMLPFLTSQKAQCDDPSQFDLPKSVAGVRICPDRVSLGHLSGSTYSEAITWGKFDPEHKDDLVRVQCDATIIFPILAKALVGYIDSKG